MLLDLTNKSQVIAAGRSLPRGVVVTDIEAKAERPSETILLQGVFQRLTPTKAWNSSSPVPSPFSLYINIVTSSPVFSSPSPGLIAHPTQQVWLFLRIIQCYKTSTEGFTIFLGFNPSNTLVWDVKAVIVNILKSRRTQSGGNWKM